VALLWPVPLWQYNGTTAGVKVPKEWAPPADRAGLAICDATSAVFAMDSALSSPARARALTAALGSAPALARARVISASPFLVPRRCCSRTDARSSIVRPVPWANLDVVTFSWQKCLGGEGAHGMLILSPRAVERLESYTPPWPMPKIFRMTKKGKLNADIFTGATINTPSMLANEDYLDSLAWAKSIGGYAGLVGRANANLAVIEKFVAASEWMDFLAIDPATRSNTSVCLKARPPTPPRPCDTPLTLWHAHRELVRRCTAAACAARLSAAATCVLPPACTLGHVAHCTPPLPLL
jgi:phosphoserine aminotransferase